MDCVFCWLALPVVQNAAEKSAPADTSGKDIQIPKELGSIRVREADKSGMPAGLDHLTTPGSVNQIPSVPEIAQTPGSDGKKCTNLEPKVKSFSERFWLTKH